MSQQQQNFCRQSVVCSWNSSAHLLRRRPEPPRTRWTPSVKRLGVWLTAPDGRGRQCWTELDGVLAVSYSTRTFSLGSRQAVALDDFQTECQVSVTKRYFIHPYTLTSLSCSAQPDICIRRSNRPCSASWCTIAASEIFKRQFSCPCRTRRLA